MKPVIPSLLALHQKMRKAHPDESADFCAAVATLAQCAYEDHDEETYQNNLIETMTPLQLVRHYLKSKIAN